jgi:hypothetical protein
MKKMTTLVKNMRLRNIVIVIFLCSFFLNSCFQKSSQINGVDEINLGKNMIAWSISWSPVDPNQLLVTALDSSKSTTQVFILNVDKGTRNLFLEVPARSIDIGALFPSIEGLGWSSDGKFVSILVSTEPAIFKPGLTLWNIEDKKIEYLDWDGRVSWSPMGNSLAFFTETPPSLHIIDIQAHRKRTIQIEENNADKIYSAGFSWSPDGEKIVYSIGNSSDRQLHIIDVLTEQVNKIQLPGNNTDPSWSPKGDLIAFRHRENSGNGYKYSFHITNISGDCDVEIPYTENATFFSWSPDGESAAYVSYGKIYLMDFQKVFKGDIYQSICH